MKKTIRRIVGGSLIVGVLGMAPFFAFAQSLPVTTSKLSVDFACLQNVVERRDNSIISAVDSYHAVVKTALETRRDVLKAAFGVTDQKQRQAAIRNGWNTYKTTQRKAKTTFRDARNAAWQKFNTDRKACGSAAAGEDKTPSGVDAEL